ncbi:acyl-CoA N-acyltransferase [Pelagophyceae sp. CCMP2097]|nr:acyl-CoA N-acyltransferase [Pelagophyceae sp. CCMP2097]
MPSSAAAAPCADGACVDGALLREAAPSDLSALARLVSEHECLVSLRRDRPALDVDHDRYAAIGAAYVAGVLRGELGSWDACSQRYASMASRLWVLEAEGRVIGSVGVVEQTESVQHETSFELVRMYVHRDHRRSGHGRRLLGRALAHARGSARVFLTTPSVNAPAVAFYQSCGFAIEKTFSVTEADWGGLDLDLVEMVQLAPATPPHGEQDERVHAAQAPRATRKLEY